MKRAVASSALLSVPLVRWALSDDVMDNSVTHRHRSNSEVKKNSVPIVSAGTSSMPANEKMTSLLEHCWSSVVEPLCTHCDIKEIDSMDSVGTSITSNTLLIYDIDNTVFEPVGNYGSDQWFYYLHKVYRMDGYSEEEAEEKALKLWNNTQHSISVRPVENSIPNLIKDQQQRGIKVIAMTARTKEMAAITLKQLESIDVNFEQSSILIDSIVEIERESSPILRSDILFSNGVLFVGEKNGKGDVLLLLLESLNYRPDNVVFVDDRLKHLIGTEKALSTISVPFQGFRYGGADEKVRAFDEFTSEILDKKTAEVFYMGKLI